MTLRRSRHRPARALHDDRARDTLKVPIEDALRRRTCTSRSTWSARRRALDDSGEPDAELPQAPGRTPAAASTSPIPPLRAHARRSTSRRAPPSSSRAARPASTSSVRGRRRRAGRRRRGRGGRRRRGGAGADRLPARRPARRSSTRARGPARATTTCAQHVLARQTRRARAAQAAAARRGRRDRARPTRAHDDGRPAPMPPPVAGDRPRRWRRAWPRRPTTADDGERRASRRRADRDAHATSTRSPLFAPAVTTDAEGARHRRRQAARQPDALPRHGGRGRRRQAVRQGRERRSPRACR